MCAGMIPARLKPSKTLVFDNLPKNHGKDAAAEQRTGVAHGATVGEIPAKPSAPDGAKEKSRGLYHAPSGAENYGTSQPTVAPWATF